jgi:hypothetical protein
MEERVSESSETEDEVFTYIEEADIETGEG